MKTHKRTPLFTSRASCKVTIHGEQTPVQGLCRKSKPGWRTHQQGEGFLSCTVMFTMPHHGNLRHLKLGLFSVSAHFLGFYFPLKQEQSSSSVNMYQFCILVAIYLRSWWRVDRKVRSGFCEATAAHPVVLPWVTNSKKRQNKNTSWRSCEIVGICMDTPSDLSLKRHVLEKKRNTKQTHTIHALRFDDS